MENCELTQTEEYTSPQVEQVLTAADLELQVQYAGRVTIIPG